MAPPVVYGGCVEEMRKLPDQSIDLCLTDPPYDAKNILWQSKGKMGGYVDGMVDGWLDEARRACKVVAFTPGTKNVFRYPPTDFFLGWFKRQLGNNQTGGSSSYEPVLVYGATRATCTGTKRTWRFTNDRIETTGLPREKAAALQHLIPRTADWFVQIIELMNPRPASLLDPFLGSGACAEACEQLGIPCLGFEKNEGCRADIEKRVAWGRAARAELLRAEQQDRNTIKLDSFLEGTR